MVWKIKVSISFFSFSATSHEIEYFSRLYWCECGSIPLAFQLACVVWILMTFSFNEMHFVSPLCSSWISQWCLITAVFIHVCRSLLLSFKSLWDMYFHQVNVRESWYEFNSIFFSLIEWCYEKLYSMLPYTLIVCYICLLKAGKKAWSIFSIPRHLVLI